MLQINKETSGKGLVYKLSGRLDTITSPDLEKELKALRESEMWRTAETVRALRPENNK